MKPIEGRRRVVIESVAPQVDCGRYAVKRVLGERFAVFAAIFADGHDVISARLLHKRERDRVWQATSMEHIGNDIWLGAFAAETIGAHRYCVEAWVDDFATWRRDLEKRAAAGEDLSLALRSGALLLEQAAGRAKKKDGARLRAAAVELRKMAEQGLGSGAASLSPEIVALANKYPDLRFAARHSKELELWVDRERAAFSSWYELFPRSTAAVEGEHGTFADCEALLPSIAAMGFDVLYLPPIHPIGESYRKGRNNAPEAAPGDVGSPWAIGSELGGHKSIHPQLGTLEEFQHLVEKTKEAGMEIALDIAFQCSPDHPYVGEHPSWFRHRPDGSVQYAENPPKKYQDIYPFDFETIDWRAMWDELKSVFIFWAEQGVRIFRVDNPHTKSFAFWEWAIVEVRKEYPDAIFLAEAFTRPHVMYELAKRGFSQSYTYFTWKTTKAELTDYFTELSQNEVKEFFRPNVWPNTPDILHESLQKGGRAEFVLRAVLAATLGANYGIYGPAYELCEHVAVREGSEEYLDSEKYQLRHSDRGDKRSLAPLLTRLNEIRKSEAALRNIESLRFHEVENDSILCYSKSSPDGASVVLVAVNLDPSRTQSGWTKLDLKAIRMGAGQEFTVTDLLDDAGYMWSGERNYIELSPGTRPAHIFRVSPSPVRTADQPLVEAEDTTSGMERE